MNIMKSLDISASAMTLQRLRMDVISQNIANENTTRTERNIPYRRRLVLVQEQKDYRPFSQHMDEVQARFDGNGVKAVKIVKIHHHIS